MNDGATHPEPERTAPDVGAEEAIFGDPDASVPDDTLVGHESLVMLDYLAEHDLNGLSVVRALTHESPNGGAQARYVRWRARSDRAPASPGVLPHAAAEALDLHARQRAEDIERRVRPAQHAIDYLLRSGLAMGLRVLGRTDVTRNADVLIAALVPDGGRLELVLGAPGSWRVDGAIVFPSPDGDDDTPYRLAGGAARDVLDRYRDRHGHPLLGRAAARERRTAERRYGPWPSDADHDASRPPPPRSPGQTSARRVRLAAPIRLALPLARP